MKGSSLIVLLALSGCDLVGASGDWSWKDGVTGECDIIVENTWPLDGADDVFYRDAISFELSRPDRSARVVFGAAGTQRFQGESGEVVVFTPDEPLALDTSYEVGLEYCHGSPTISFETSDIGRPLEDTSAVLGQTYRIDIDQLRFVKNEGFGEFISSWYGRDMLLEVIWFDGINLGVRLAVPTPEDQLLDQDFCFRTFDQYGLKLSDTADVTFESSEVALEFYQSDLEIYDVEVGLTVGPDLSVLDGGSVSGWMNIGGLTAALDMGDTNQVCDFIDALGSNCEPCPYDGGDACVHVIADRLKGQETGFGLDRVMERDTHPQCPLLPADCLSEEDSSSCR